MKESVDKGSGLRDPLAPSDEKPLAGLAEVRKTLKAFRRNHVLVYDANAMVPRRISRREAMELIEGLRHRQEACIVTARFRGSDLVLRTIEWMGDPGRPARPRPLGTNRKPKRHGKDAA